MCHSTIKKVSNTINSLAAGDHCKFGFPLAFSVTCLSWGMIDHAYGYEAAGI